MYIGRRKYFLCSVCAGLCLVSKTLFAVQVEPGVGAGVEYTDNARLTQDNEVNDVITVGYVGIKLFENEGPLKYDASTSFNNTSYTQDTFADQHYINLAANADWEMIKQRLDWFASDVFTQRTVNSLNSNTPDNLQDTNAFNFGANVRFPISQRQNFTLTPSFGQYYYERLLTDNKQYSLAANWNYQMFRLTNVGLNFSTRRIDYFEQAIEDTRFTNASIVFSGQRQRSTFSINLGSTNVKRGDGKGETGFSGYMDWLADFTSRSKFSTRVSSIITDTSSTALSPVANPVNGSGSDVQVTTDVIRNSSVDLAYLRDDASVNSRFWFKYQKLTYSENPLDRVVRAFGATLNYPVTQLLSAGVSANYNRTKQLDTARLDERYSVGGNLRYKISRKLHGSFDIGYRKKESTTVAENYDEFNVFASVVYGFGNVQKPSRTGGF